MNSPRLPPLSNRHLPKITYGKFNDKPPTRASKKNTNDQGIVAVHGKSNKEHIKPRRSQSFQQPSDDELVQNAGSSFPRFAVLPPIPGRQRSARGSQTRLVLSNSCINDNWPNGTRNEQGNHFGSDKRRGSGFVASSQRRSSSMIQDLVIRQDGPNNDLEIVGNALGDKIQFRNYKDRQSFDTADKTLPIPCESTGEYDRENANKNGGKLVASEGRTNAKWVGDEPTFPRKSRKSSKALNIQKHNSEIASQARFLSANDPMDVSTNSNKLSLSLPQSTERPLSRGQISFAEFVDGDLPKGNQQSPVQERRKSFGRLSTSMPVIQIDGLPASDNNEGTRETASSSQAASNWQLLMDSLENAKDDLPKQSIGVPYTSLREKRRRSALCRNNSKQVDDFLLVHNLRDLGLL